MRTPIPTPARLTLALTAALAGTACEIEYEIHPIVTPDDACVSGCFPAEAGAWSNGGVASQAGSAVEIVSFGYRGADEKSKRVAAIGAPAYGTGSFHVDAVSSSTGLPTGAPVRIGAPPASPARFGASLLAVDVREGSMIPGFPPQSQRFGEELLVGAPGSSPADRGAVFWYHHKSTDAGDSWVLGGRFDPPGIPDSAQFGASLAAPHHLDANAPSKTDSGPPPWIAIGAPGADRVYVAAVNPAAANPLTLAMTVFGPAGTGFGTSLAIADLDQDGDLDLAIGAPDDDGGQGGVHVVPGIPGAIPLDAAGVRAFPASVVGSGYAEDFGASMDAGFIFTTDLAWPALVVGDPLADDYADPDVGAVSQIQLDGALNLAWHRMDHGGYGRDAHFGAAVAVGNFLAKDAGGSESSDCALAEEIAVSAPGESRGYTRNGVVAVYEACADPTGGALANDPAVEIYGDQDDDGAGAALASDFVQRNGHEDLVIGRPTRGGDRGGYRLTKAGTAGGLDDPFGGTWTGDDSSGSPFDLDVVWDVDPAGDDVLRVTMLSNANVRVADSYGTGSTCSVLGYDGDFTGVLPFPEIAWNYPGSGDWSAPADIDISDLVPVAGTWVVEADLEYDESAGEFRLDFSGTSGAITVFGSDCRVEGDPWTFTRTASRGCE